MPAVESPSLGRVEKRRAARRLPTHQFDRCENHAAEAMPLLRYGRFLFLRGFTPARFDFSAQVREQPTRHGFRAIRRIGREFGFVFEVNDDGSRHHAIGTGVIDAVQFHAQRVRGFVFCKGQDKSDISKKTRHYRFDLLQIKKYMQIVAY